MIYFTADDHFSHSNIIKYCNRPFADAHDMNTTLTKNWNSVVKEEEDIIYVIGDFTMTHDEKHIAKLLEKLNGEKHLILGNHDRLKPFQYVDAGFMSVATSAVLKYNEWEFILSHDPATAIIKPDRQFLCGHVHGLFLRCKNVLNVGVDLWDYKPVSIEQVTDYLLKN